MSDRLKFLSDDHPEWRGGYSNYEWVTVEYTNQYGTPMSSQIRRDRTTGRDVDERGVPIELINGMWKVMNLSD